MSFPAVLFSLPNTICFLEASTFKLFVILITLLATNIEIKKDNIEQTPAIKLNVCNNIPPSTLVLILN